MKIVFLKAMFLIAIFAVSLSGVGVSSLTIVPVALADSDKDKDDDKDTGKDEHKVTLCHFPPGNAGNPGTLSVSEEAVDTHLAHGDYIGQCPCLCPPGVVSCVCADGKDGLPTPANMDPSPSSQRNILGK